jgi:hypothetical protein
MNIKITLPPDTVAWWICAAVGCYFIADFCLLVRRETRGKGSWAKDEQLTLLAGCLGGWGLVCLAMAINDLIGWIC